MITTKLNELLVCRHLLSDPVIGMLMSLKEPDSPEAYKLSAELMAASEKLGLYGNAVGAYILYRLAHDESIVAVTTEANGDIGQSLLSGFVHDMAILLPFMETPPGKYLATPLLDDYQPTKKRVTESAASLAPLLSERHTAEAAADIFLNYYRRFGYGDIATYRAFRYDNGALVGIRHFEPIVMDDLIGYKHQKEQLMANTAAFVAGRSANNVLLVGARGTGKSSSVKALANEFFSQGLRLLQITKPQLKDLPDIMETLRHFASKRFIIFIDDLSFEETDAEYKNLKSAIEGGVEARPQNVLLYATSNRRHLIRESWRDRGDEREEIYRDDSLNEMISLSDRFGLTIHYFAPNNQEYLAIIAHMLKKEGVTIEDEELRLAGLRWEMTHSGRSGRTAKQFVNHYLGQKG